MIIGVFWGLNEKLIEVSNKLRVSCGMESWSNDRKSGNERLDMMKKTSQEKSHGDQTNFEGDEEGWNDQQYKMQRWAPTTSILQ